MGQQALDIAGKARSELKPVFEEPGELRCKEENASPD
jgi:hypothetical protein